MQVDRNWVFAMTQWSNKSLVLLFLNTEGKTVGIKCLKVVSREECCWIRGQILLYRGSCMYEILGWCISFKFEYLKRRDYMLLLFIMKIILNIELSKNRWYDNIIIIIIIIIIININIIIDMIIIQYIFNN